MTVIDKAYVEIVPTVSAESAMACAKIVEMYVNASGADLLVHRLPDGRYTLSIVEGASDDA